MNGYGTGSVEQVYRPLGIGTIKTQHGKPAFVIFTSTAVQDGQEGFQHLLQGDEVRYQIFQGEIAGATFASDVWKATSR
jgi:cold shock CspA family protein